MGLKKPERKAAWAVLSWKRRPTHSDGQLYLALGIPILFNGIALATINTSMSSRMTDMAVSLRRDVDQFRREMDLQFKLVLGKLEELNGRLTRLEERR